MNSLYNKFDIISIIPNSNSNRRKLELVVISVSEKTEDYNDSDDYVYNVITKESVELYEKAHKEKTKCDPLVYSPITESELKREYDVLMIGQYDGFVWFMGVE